MQAAAVAVIVLLAAVYATWKLMPAALRRPLGGRIVGWVRRRGRLSDADAALLSRRLAAGGCGSCDSCGACAPQDAAAATPAATIGFLPRSAAGEPQAERSAATQDVHGG